MISKEIIKTVSEELKIPSDTVNLVYKNYWKYIKDTIESLPLKENLTKEDFKKLRTNFNIPSIGKLNLSEDRYNRKKQNFNKNINGKTDKG